jgi:hypothetical protein
MALVNPNIAMSFKPTTEYQPRNALADYAQMQQIQTGDMQMQEYRRKSEGLERIRTAISKAGGPDDLETAAQEMMKVPEYFDQGYGIYQTIRDKKAFEEYLKGKGQPVGASPVGAPTAARPTPAPGALGSGTFDIMPAFSNARYLTSGDTTDRALDDKIVQMGQSAPRDLRPRGYATPTNALAPDTATAPVAAPTNALVNPVEAIENEITQLSRFKDPRAQARVKQLERQLIAMEPTADVKTMRALGIPLTPAGYEQYRQAQRQEQLSVADRIAIAQASRAGGGEKAPSITQIVDPSNPSRMITIDARRYQGGTVGSPGVIGVGGKEPSASVRENKAEAGKTQLADDLENLRSSFLQLDKLQAIPSTQRGVVSNIMAGTAATGLGQAAGRLVGTEAQVEREVINSARSRLVNSIKNATGMSAQQLNSNVELQTMLKSISDPGQPIEAALRIIDDIENAYVKGQGMPKKPAKPAGGTPPPPPGFAPD